MNVSKIRRVFHKKVLTIVVISLSATLVILGYYRSRFYQIKASLECRNAIALLGYLNITLVVLDPQLLAVISKKDGTSFDRTSCNDAVFGVKQSQSQKLYQLRKRFQQTSLTSGILPADVLGRPNRKYVLCARISFTDLHVTIVVLYVKDHYVYVPSCLTDSKVRRLNSTATLGKTPLVFDKFGVKYVTRYARKLAIPNNIAKYIIQFPSSRYHECQRGLAKNFTNQNEPEEKAAAWLKSALYLKKIFMDIGKLPMIFSGTLLGWYRNCHIIRGSTDVDFCLFRDSLDLTLHNKLRHDKNIEGVTFNMPQDGFQYQIYALGQKFDIYFMFNTNNTNVVYTGEWAPARDRLRLFYPRSEVCSAILLGHRFNIPCRVEAILKAEYGEKWRIPVKSFSWITSPYNIENIGPWTDQQWPYAHVDIKKSDHILEMIRDS